MVKANVPRRIGVPLITPSALSVRPKGNSPDITDHVIGSIPLAESRLLYASPTVPCGKTSEFVIIGAVFSINRA